jgi:hypothetical protein
MPGAVVKGELRPLRNPADDPDLSKLLLPAAHVISAKHTWPRSPYRSGLPRFSVHLLLKPRTDEPHVGAYMARHVHHGRRLWRQPARHRARRPTRCSDTLDDMSRQAATPAATLSAV